jgi:hypothetical protein
VGRLGFGDVAHPLVYEINAWVWLGELSAIAGRPVDLGSVPPAAWDALAALGPDAVWLMGVWERSPAGVAVALANPDLVASFRATLPDYRDADVVGSPYCVRGYQVEAHLGGPAGLAAARAALADRGVGLVLDFVPNHVAPDHPWTRDRPELFVAGSDDDLRAEPAAFVRVGDRVLANGRDPYFPAWPDVVQLDAFSPALRGAAVETLDAIARQCDGVRCDMAMLMMNDVFAKTWGDRVGPAPAEDYWVEVIGAVRRDHPGFAFVAEAYWDLEWALIQQGFDHCYDKRLYDRLVSDTPESVRLHLTAGTDYQSHLLRFLENHDEPRAAATFPPDRLRAATVATLTQTGARLVHHGQITGARVHLPVFLGRGPAEQPDADLAAFHRALLVVLADPALRTGEWALAATSGWPGNDRWGDLVAWSWRGDAGRWLVVVNLGDATACGHVAVGWDELRGRDWHLTDPTTGDAFDRRGDDLVDGLYVELAPGAWHVLRIEEPPG